MNIGALFGESQAVTPEVVPPPPAVPTERPNALAIFRSDPAALKASALSVLDIKVKAPEDEFQAAKLADLRAQAKLVLKNIEHRRKTITEPLYREMTEVNAEAKTWSDPLKAWDKNAERALLAYQRKQNAEATKAEEKRQALLVEAAEKQDDTAIMHLEAQAPVEAVKGFKTDAGTTSLRTRWKVEVIDPEQVPPRFLIPDLKALQAAVDAGARQIEGCNVFPEESLTVRTR